MGEITRLGTAIKTISEKYLGNVIRAGDTEGILKWSTRLADYSTRLAALVAPALTVAEAKELAVEAEASLSTDPSIALQQILAATGNPLTFTEGGATVALDPANVLADATPEQVRELALLGFFAQAGTHPGVDYSLFELYYEATGGGNWAPKEPYLVTGTWQAYRAGKA